MKREDIAILWNSKTDSYCAVDESRIMDSYLCELRNEQGEPIGSKEAGDYTFGCDDFDDNLELHIRDKFRFICNKVFKINQKGIYDCEVELTNEQRDAINKEIDKYYKENAFIWEATFLMYYNGENFQTILLDCPIRKSEYKIVADELADEIYNDFKSAKKVGGNKGETKYEGEKYIHTSCKLKHNPFLFETFEKESRYILKKSNNRPNWLVVTDTKNGIVCEFERGNFNDTQSFTMLEDPTTEQMDNLPTIMKEFGDWLAKNNYAEAMVNAAYIVRDREAGNEIERFCTLIEALDCVRSFYLTDKEDDVFVENYYEIYDADKEEIIEMKDENSTCDERKYISSLVKDERTKLGWTVYKLAKESRVQEITIHNIEKGKFDVKSETLIRLATAMGKRLTLTDI